jgi:hypothetical protein
MLNYFYGFVTMGIMVAMVDIIDGNVPNNLWYYIDLYLPF